MHPFEFQKMVLKRISKTFEIQHVVGTDDCFSPAAFIISTNHDFFPSVHLSLLQSLYL
jgi:hypothetical protein